MPLATVSTIGRPAIAYRPALSVPALPSLRRMLAIHRRRRLDRFVEETLVLLDHPGVVEDYRAARERW